jgi:hypothetical protein
MGRCGQFGWQFERLTVLRGVVFCSRLGCTSAPTLLPYSIARICS